MTTVGSWILLLFCAALQAGANLLFRGGLLQGGGLPDQVPGILRGLLGLLRQPLFVVGVVSYVLAALVWMKILAAEPITLCYPLLVSFTFLFVTMGGAWFFREPLGVAKVVGLAVIVVGILVVSKS